MFSLSIISCKAIFCPLSFDRYHENAGAGIKKRQFNLHSTKNKRSKKTIETSISVPVNSVKFPMRKKTNQNKTK